MFLIFNIAKLSDICYVALFYLKTLNMLYLRHRDWWSNYNPWDPRESFKKL